MNQKKVLCSSCDIYCQVGAERRDDGLVQIKALDPRPDRANICMKGVHAPEGFDHPNRIRYPLKRAGARGANKWQRVSWDVALDDIAGRLGTLIAAHGPEAFAVSESPWNIQTGSGMSRRFMNLIGSPNWLSGVALCAGNTAAINRMVYGWYPYPDYTKTNCVVLFGHNPWKHSWTPVYNSIRQAQKRGAKLIVLDPRRSENAELADIWLPLRVGTDAAMCLGWLHVIINENLYDHDFVARWTVGFDALCRRIRDYPLDRVAAITGVNPQQITAAARLYATTSPAVIPWSPITDQQRNSTSAIRLQGILRALTGNLDVPGGEVLHGFHPTIVNDSELELHDQLPSAQKMKQLGSDIHPAFTYRGTASLNEPTKRVWGHEYANIVAGSYMANPSAVFQAMADSIPYPVKAFFSLGNNTVMSFANMQLIYRGLMNQDLVVALEHVMTPTAQLADYVLPGDSWLERPALSDGFGWTAIMRTSQQVMSPQGECRNVYDLWKGLADRMGIGAQFPWTNLNQLLDYRVAAMGKTFDEFARDSPTHMEKLRFKKYEETGFATPTGKVELYSTVLESLGFDPLPYHREEPAVSADLPLLVFTGIREPEFFQTGQRHIASLRARNPEPRAFLNPDDAGENGIETGDWIEVRTEQGKCIAQAMVRHEMPKGLVRVPHGWWKPETTQGSRYLSGAWTYADAQICPDGPDYLDREQGIPHLRGIACAIRKLEQDD
ncbi:molybdopterin-containing oxidoreductase family protein [Bradyrhizobium australafricanum]|uniref:molybdopterin-containing oxidoreductase family protein n=1 Tax=Bradyrhizobium australafricanum TaxID=2821406 RepID=UPI001CE3592F|nr:molybdopterin-dependent oxidoreductase [Bradyrhizobium australafricanum]MCA6098406.1 molybdopterin-dependent oxidoreductase [Bradyrhizobium australafricanum]